MVGISLIVCPFYFQSPHLLALFPESPPFSVQIEEKGEGASVWANIHIHHAFLTCSLSPCWVLFWCIYVALNIFHRWDVWVINSMDSSVQFSSVTQSCPTLCDPMNRSMPGLPVHHQLPESAQTHVHRVCDSIQPSHPLSSPSPPALYLSQHQGLSQWVSSSHEVAKVLEFQLQHQSFQWTPRTDLL